MHRHIFKYIHMLDAALFASAADVTHSSSKHGKNKIAHISTQGRRRKTKQESHVEVEEKVGMLQIERGVDEGKKKMGRSSQRKRARFVVHRGSCGTDQC